MAHSLHIIGSKTLGGAERFCLRLVEALHEQGEPVTTAYRRGSEVVAENPAGVPLNESPMRTVWDPVSKRAISRIIRRVKPDIVQTYMGRATRLTRLPPQRGVVHVARLGGYYKLKGYLHAHAWIGNTKGVCDYMVRSGLPAHRVHHIYNFIDPPEPVDADVSAGVRRGLGIPDKAMVLVTAGRFVEVKGHRYLLEALSRLPAEIDGRPIYLVMVGEGVLGEALRRQTVELGIEDRVIWTGWQTAPGRFYQMADLIVFPSLEQETLGNVILEAWAYGKPLVTAAFRGAREISVHGEDAWQVPCADAPALAEGIAAVLAEPALAAEMAQRGSARVRAEFSREAIVRQYIELYDALLQGGG
jgi:glycosyltransferase involved in cell wall biosynthesis